MSEYWVGVFAVCLVGGVLIKLFRGSGDVARLAVTVITVYVIVTPLLGAFREVNIEDFFDKIEISNVEPVADYEKTASEALESGVKKAVVEKFSLPDESVEVLVYDLDFQSMKAAGIKVILSGRAAASDYRKIENYLNELNIGECSVEIKIG